MRNPGWYLDETAYAGNEHLDPEYVATYDRKAGVDPTEDLELFRGLGLSETSVVVDLGAGTGVFALAAAPLCDRVVAVDVAPAMIESLRSKAKAIGVANLDVVRAGYLSYQHLGDPADFVYSRNALHHLPDFWKAIALKRIADILKPGGILRLHDLVYSFDPHDAVSQIESWLEGAADRPDAGWTRAELETHVREEYSTFSWLLESMLERAGFEIKDARYRPTGPYAAYTCVKL